MRLDNFLVERYFARYEFQTKYLLSSSDCDGYPMEYVLKLASSIEKERWEKLTLGYTETRGSEFLRESISKHYTTIGLNNIVVCAPGEANFSLMNVLLDRGDQVVCMAPAYQSLYQIAKNLGCNLSLWKPVEKEGGWFYSTEDLNKLVTPKTKLVVVNFPHNPTGFMPSLNEFQQIIEIVRKNNVTLFSDEMYRHLCRNKNADLPSASDLYDNGVSLWGMAKTFGLAGLRLGWLTSKNENLLEKIEAFKDYLTICNNAPSEILASIALNNLDKFLEPNLKKIESNTTLFSDFQKRNQDILEFSRPVAGSTAFVRLHIQESAYNFSERLVKDTGIMLLPSETFEYGDKHVRIGFGRSNMPEILDKLDSYLKVYRTITPR